MAFWIYETCDYMSLENLFESYNCYLVVLKLPIQITNIIVQLLFGTVLHKMYSVLSTKIREKKLSSIE